MSLTLISAAEHQRRRGALAACGLDPELTMTRGSSYANEVWLGEEVVLRVNWRGGGRLAREARIAARLAPEARYPPILAVGGDGEAEWMLCRRVAGRELGRAWQAMTTTERERAIGELATALAAVHATPCDGIPDDIRPPHTLPLAPLLALIDPLPELRDELSRFVRARWPAFDDTDRGLAHGDPHLENVLWDGAHVSALLDLEWSRPSWIHVDVEILVSLSAEPASFASRDYAHAIDPATYEAIPAWLRAVQPAWFAHPRLVERLELLHVSRLLGMIEDEGVTAARLDELRALL